MVTTLNNRTVARDQGYQNVQYICGRVTLAAADSPVVKIGTVPAGCILLAIYSRIVTLFAGGTPVIGVGTTAALIGSSGNINGGVIPITAGSGITVPAATVAEPLAVDTDIYVGTSGAATVGDGIFVVAFVKPLS